MQKRSHKGSDRKTKKLPNSDRFIHSYSKNILAESICQTIKIIPSVDRLRRVWYSDMKGCDPVTKEEFLEYCLQTYGTAPDHPFDGDFETAVLRHRDNQKWYALVMRLPRCKFGLCSIETVDVVNLKLPTEMFGSFGPSDGVYPAYHMNKLHWISVILSDAPLDLVQFLVNASFKITSSSYKRK